MVNAEPSPNSIDSCTSDLLIKYMVTVLIDSFAVLALHIIDQLYSTGEAENLIAHCSWLFPYAIKKLYSRKCKLVWFLFSLLHMADTIKGN